MLPLSTLFIRTPNCLSAPTKTPRPPSRAWRACLSSVWAGAALCATASCSLLAPSDRALTGDTQADDAGDAARDQAAAWCGSAADCGSSTCCQAGCNRGECASCSLNGDPCRSDSDCCSRSCNGNGLCQQGSCSDQGCGQCAPSGGNCSQPADCCAGTCIGGSCAACLALGASCRMDTDCCSLVCNSDGVCSPCLAAGSPCGSSAGTHCCSGHCRDTSSCQ
jgi:hypothetical protein